jgi:hypothetical protein
MHAYHLDNEKNVISDITTTAYIMRSEKIRIHVFIWNTINISVIEKVSI